MSQVVQRPHERRRRASPAARGLLCVSNFASNTGYAWDFIEGVFAQLADRLSEGGIRTWVAYPEMKGEPRTLEGSCARAIELDVSLASRSSLAATLRFVRDHNIEVVYLCDRPAWSPRYRALRRAGVRRIVIHDHTSGERTEPRGLKRILKRARMALPGSVADEVIAVSDFVAERQRRVEVLPAGRVQRVWNSIEPVPTPPDAADRLRRWFGISRERSVVVCACRATREKGVDVLLRAFDRLVAALPAEAARPALIYMGDGPALDEVRALRDMLPARDDIIIAGFVGNAAELCAGADVCVVPSLWQEAFGLAALEPMAHGVAVIASRAGGLPEIVIDGETGRLVPPGDVDEMAKTLGDLLSDPRERARLGANGRTRAREVFSRATQLDQLHSIIEASFG